MLSAAIRRARRGTLTAFAIAAAALGGSGVPAHAQTDPTLGQIAVFGFNFCPTGWVAADGSLLQVSSYQALFALYGTTYGGNGTTTFGVPRLSVVTAPNSNATSKTMTVCVATSGTYPDRP